MGGGLATEPVGDGGEDVGGDDEEGEVVLEEGAAEDDEEEADGEDLQERLLAEELWRVSEGGIAYEGEDYDCLEAGHDCGMAIVVSWSWWGSLVSLLVVAECPGLSLWYRR